MRNIYIPTHFNAGNRGCEAISLGISKILSGYNIIAYSSDTKTDAELKTQINIVPNIPSSKLRTFFYMTLRNMPFLNKYRNAIKFKERYKNFLKDLSDDVGKNIVLSTGGDMYCYDDNEVMLLNQYLSDNALSVLWGCSIQKEKLTPLKISSLRNFDYIIARESKTFALLKDELKISNVVLCPDPAFVLNTAESGYIFPKDNEGVVGLNLSNFVSEKVLQNTIFIKNLDSLITYIFNQTQMDILLIPHVFWKGQDDRIICKSIYDKYKSSGRIHYLEGELYSYCQIRSIIGQCRFFIGARTHSMISAYSMTIPSLALGYSVKSKGIAEDLGLSSQLVVDYNALVSDDKFKTSFIYLKDNEQHIRTHLQNVVPQYSNQAYDAKKIIDILLESS